MFFDVVAARSAGEYRIDLTFEDGSHGVVDLSEYATDDGVFRAFLDPLYVERFRIEYGTLVWGDGEVDIAPEALYTRATGNPVEYRSNRAHV